jgi:hypothetical protein
MYTSTPTSQSLVHDLVRCLYDDRLSAFTRPQGSGFGFFFTTASAPSSSAAAAEAPVDSMAAALEAAGDDFLKPDKVPVAPGLTPCCIKKNYKKKTKSIFSADNFQVKHLQPLPCWLPFAQAMLVKEAHIFPHVDLEQKTVTLPETMLGSQFATFLTNYHLMSESGLVEVLRSCAGPRMTKVLLTDLGICTVKPPIGLAMAAAAATKGVEDPGKKTAVRNIKKLLRDLSLLWIVGMCFLVF